METVDYLREAYEHNAERGPSTSDEALLDMWAGMAMQGELACQREDYEWSSLQNLARNSWDVAEAMLAEKKRRMQK